MRKTFNLLFVCLIALYGRIGYQIIHNTDLPQCQPEGSLSDVAEEVIAIPLETNKHCSLKKIRMIKRDREDLFLVSDRQLYHFNSSGKFLGQITTHRSETGQPVELADYAVDPVHDRLIVIGTGHEVYYYDYDGKLLFQSILPQDASWKTFGHIAYYDNHLWATIDLINSENEQAPTVEQWLYKFDLEFKEAGKRKLDVADLGRMEINHKTGPEIAVKDGHVYVQSPSLQPAHILNDTLYLIYSNQLDITEDYAQILPLQIGTRFLVSTHYDPTLPEHSYTFCYDQQETKAYNVQGGLEDNFYKTGKIPELQSIDLQSNTYCYCKSGKELAYSFPRRTNKDNPVLFIVKMKA
ncbi:6-bladed beta-propeller [Parabacteroides massiliensis]|uniref:6-bladed beta-propeller n=1 Tax=Parabacteroides massiliensis TaxID=1750560 RepID=UPI00096A974A|nr:6-bladed beta-propeller [Parabacteroides massiliensis]